MIRVVIIDDHEIVRKGLSAYLATDEAIDVIGEASNGHEGAALVLALKPDVVLMDLIMENGTGIEATETILAQDSTCKIIILTSYFDDEQLFPAIKAGAFSYILKTATANEIATVIKQAAAGKQVIADQLAGRVLQGYQVSEAALHSALTEREYEVLLCIGHGLTNQEIGDKLYIGIKTVKTHVSNILAKLNLRDRTQVAVYVHQNKLLS